MEAYYGEVLTTCEKLRWIIRYGANALKTESRPPPFLLMFNKKARVEYYPIGVIGIIIPWVSFPSAVSVQNEKKGIRVQ
jgi:acyl-CoA reductase-like NAD-dependent aldehyde dehydrogenase